MVCMLYTKSHLVLFHPQQQHFNQCGKNKIKNETKCYAGVGLVFSRGRAVLRGGAPKTMFHIVSKA